MNDIEKAMMKRMVIWTAVGLGLSYAINVIMFSFLGESTFPFNLIVLIGVFLAVGWFYMKRQMRRLPQGATFLGAMGNPNDLKYECSQCSFTYKGEKCPRCGNKGGKAIFG